MNKFVDRVGDLEPPPGFLRRVDRALRNAWFHNSEPFSKFTIFDSSGRYAPTVYRWGEPQFPEVCFFASGRTHLTLADQFYTLPLVLSCLTSICEYGNQTESIIVDCLQSLLVNLRFSEDTVSGSPEYWDSATEAVLHACEAAIESLDIEDIETFVFAAVLVRGGQRDIAIPDTVLRKIEQEGKLFVELNRVLLSTPGQDRLRWASQVIRKGLRMCFLPGGGSFWGKVLSLFFPVGQRTHIAAAVAVRAVRDIQNVLPETSP
jgi:hypothetical protein